MNYVVISPVLSLNSITTPLFILGVFSLCSLFTVLLKAQLRSHRHGGRSISWPASAYKVAHTSWYFWLQTARWCHAHKCGEPWCEAACSASSTMTLLSFKVYLITAFSVWRISEAQGLKQLPRLPWKSSELNLVIMRGDCVI